MIFKINVCNQSRSIVGYVEHHTDANQIYVAPRLLKRREVLPIGNLGYFVPRPKEAFHSECSLLASLIRFLVIILTNTSLQLVNFLSRRLFTTCKVIYATYRDGRTSSPLALIVLSLLTECGRKGKTMRRSATFAVILGLAVLALTVQLLPELSARSDQNEGNVFTVISRDAVACGRT